MKLLLAAIVVAVVCVAVAYSKEKPARADAFGRVQREPTVEEQIEDLRAEVGDLRVELGKLQQEVSGIWSDVDDLKGKKGTRVGTLESLTGDLETEIKKIKRRLDELEAAKANK